MFYASEAGVAELIHILGTGDEEEAVKKGFLGRKLAKHQRQEAMRGCRSLAVREGE